MGRWEVARRPGASRQASAPSGAGEHLGGELSVARTEPEVVHRYQPAGIADRVLIALSGLRQPIVAILLVISFMSTISGKPLDGLLMVSIAIALAWDAGMRSRAAGTDSSGAISAAVPAEPTAPADAQEQRPAWRPRARRPRLRHLALGTTAALIYSITMGSFTRYSWPVTAGVVGLGAGVVIVGWGGPTRSRLIPGKFSRHGAAAWGTLLVAGGLWELGALLGQPTLERSSYAHPTISALTNPLLLSPLGRSLAFFGWIAFGAYLVER